MIKKILWFFILFPLASFAKTVLPIQHWQLANGAKVYFVYAPEIPMLDLKVVFRAGAAYDGKEPGIANMTNTMLNTGAGDLSADQIAEQFDRVGAKYVANVSRDMSIVGLRSLTNKKYLKPALATLTKVLLEPNFPQDQFQRELRSILGSIQKQEQSPNSVAKNAFYKAVYGEAPYGHPVIGFQQSVSKITPADLRRFYQRYYVGKNAVVAIVGAINLAQAKQIANEIIGRLPAGVVAPQLPLAQSLRQSAQINISFPSEQTNVYIGQVGITRKDPSYFPLIVGNYILGGGMVSRLFQSVREKEGLAYSVYSQFSPGLARGPFYINLQTRNKEAKQAIRITQSALKKFIKKGPNNKELTLAKRYVKEGFPLRIASNSSIVRDLIMISFYQLPLDYLDTYQEKVRAVTKKEIQRAFSHYIQPKKMVVITVGN